MRPAAWALAALLVAGCEGAGEAPGAPFDAGLDAVASADGGAEVGGPRDAGPDVLGSSADARPADATWPDVPPPPSEVPACDGPVLAALDALAPVAAGSDGWSASPQAPLLSEALWAAATTSPLAGLELASQAGYAVCRGTGAEADLTLWRPLDAGAGYAWMVLRDEPTRGVVLSVPHPWFELYVRGEGAALFAGLGARALVVSGTHRCANAAPTSCDGLTTACGASAEPYRESDMAHTVASTFHALHVGLFAAWPEDVVVSLHGMGGAGASVSDGTKAATGGAGAAAAVALALAAALPGEPITSCSPDVGVPQDERLCGTTNVQGRLVNGAGAVCTSAAAAASGRFVHLEQSQAVRQQAAKVLEALAAGLPAVTR